MQHRRPTLLASTLAALLAGGALVVELTHGRPAAVVPAPAVEPPAAFLPVPAPVEAAAPSPVPRASAPAPARTSVETLSQKVDRLGRSANPVDAFAAYQLVTNCLWARDHEGWMARHILPGDRGLLPTTQQACGDIASDQVQTRLHWLERAALAGVHHAATEMLREGPDGLGVSASSDPDAPENADWKQRVQAALDAGVRTCDADSLESRVNRYETGQGVPPDRAKALTYWVAYLGCRERLGTSADLAPSAAGAGDDATGRMGGALSAEQIARAVAEGQALARDAQPLPGDH